MKKTLLILYVLSSSIACTTAETGNAAPAGQTVTKENDGAEAILPAVPPAASAARARRDSSSDADAGGALPPGNHLGVHPGFNPDNPPGLIETMDARWGELVDAGMEVARVFMDWRDLEPELGTYNKDLLEQRLLEYSEQGLAIYLSIVSVDSEGLVVPEDLMAGDEGYELAGGISFDDPAVIDAYSTVLDWAVPVAEEHGVFAISVANEPDTRYLEDDPEFLFAVRNFVSAEADHIRLLSDTIHATMTLTMSSALSGDPDVRSMFDLLDAVSFNYGHSVSGDDWRRGESAMVAAMVDAAAGKPIYIQELMANSEGPVNFLVDEADGNVASEERQAEFFSWFLEKMAKVPNLRAAFVLQLVDWSPEVAAWYEDVFAQEGFAALGARYRAVLEGLGLLSFPDGRAKPAFDVVLQGVARFARNR